MTQEEAHRRETQESQRIGEQIPVQSASTENLGRTSDAASPIEQSAAVEKTMRKAQKQTDKANPPEKSRTQFEAEKPERTLKAAEDPRIPMTLPVVSESGESADSIGNQKRALSPPNEAEEEGERTPSHSSLMQRSSTPGLRKVSPSTIATASDMEGDDTSVSSPQTHPVDSEPASHDDDDYPSQKEEVDHVSEKPPRIQSDLIQPHSPLEDSVFKSLDHQVGDSAYRP